MPQVSVIITTYNYGHLIAESIESVINQDCDDAELIVVDDGSTDETAGVVARYGDSVRYVRQEHSGIAAARNRGIAEARSDLIAFQDADDVWAPNTLSLRVEAMRRHPELGMIFGDASVVKDGEVIVPSFLSARTSLETLATIRDGQRVRIIAESAFPALLRERFVPIPTIIIPKKRFEQAGPWNASFEGVEDYEFYLRLAKRFRIGYIDQVLVTCRIHGANVSCSVAAQNERRINLLRGFEDDPDLTQTDRSALRLRLSELYLESAWLQKNEGNNAGARRDYINAWSYDRSKIGALLRYAALVLLPNGARGENGGGDG